MTDRLRRFGVTETALEHLTYVRPERSWKASIIEHEAWTELIEKHYTLAVIDGVTEALTLFGFETNDNDGITKFMRLIPRQIARHTKAATVLIDHIAKGASTRFAIGGQAKLAAIDGASYLVDIIEPPAIGKQGTLKMSITKDRPGQIRSHCVTDNTKNNRVQLAAIITIDSTGDDTDMTIGAPDPDYAKRSTGRALQEEMKQLSQNLQLMWGDNPFSKADCEKRQIETGFERPRFRELLKALVDAKAIVDSGDPKKQLKQIGYYIEQTYD
jgi:hypothetical protein